jgi:hypothetical protein
MNRDRLILVVGVAIAVTAAAAAGLLLAPDVVPKTSSAGESNSIAVPLDAPTADPSPDLLPASVAPPETPPVVPLAAKPTPRATGDHPGPAKPAIVAPPAAGVTVTTINSW